MVELHIIPSGRLMRAALPGMIARRHGGIINVSSNAAFYPIPRNANYSATKAYLNVFTQAVHHELRGTGVRVQALCPGFTHTELQKTLTDDERRRIPEFLWMMADDVVEASLDGLERDEVLSIPGMKNKLIAIIGRIGVPDVLMDVYTR